MDVSVYYLLALLTLCRLGSATSGLDTIVDTKREDFQQDAQNLKRSGSQGSRDVIGAFPDQKFRHLGLGKRTLDFFRFHSKVGKRLDLLALIQNNLDKSQTILSRNPGTFVKDELPLRFGSRVSPLHRSVRDRKHTLRMSDKGTIRGRRQKVDPYMYLIGVGK